MSGGLNRQFRASPTQFMQTHAFNTQPDNSLVTVQPGVIELNLMAEGTFNKLSVTTVKKAPKDKNVASHAFKAYYLPWIGKETPSLQLGTEADYFFTAAITGCRLIIGAGTLPRITHVDGGFYNDAKMNAMCATRSNGSNFGSERCWDNGEFYGTVVVGVRDTGGWTFHAQSFNYDSSFPLTTTRV
jgi:hypothetical protein